MDWGGKEGATHLKTQSLTSLDDLRKRRVQFEWQEAEHTIVTATTGVYVVVAEIGYGKGTLCTTQQRIGYVEGGL